MRVLVVSLGCDKNLVDTEFMIGTLQASGHTFTNEEDEADAIVINSCCFINDAKEESINTILEMAEYKKLGSCKALIVTGCLAERYREEIITEIPEVDVVLGTNSYEEIARALEEVQKGKRYTCYHSLEGLRQALQLLYYSFYPRRLSQRAHGGFTRAGAGLGRTGRQRIDFSCAGDDVIRRRFVRREISA